MKIRLLIASGDTDYAEHLSTVFAKKHADTFEVTVCTIRERLDALLKERSFDVGLLEAPWMAEADITSLRIPLLLWDEENSLLEQPAGLKRIRKYQRVSAIAGGILESCAQASMGKGDYNLRKARITAFWSPAGGVGKTTVALAYATRKVAGNQQALYLDLEYFSSTPVYFRQTGKSISALFDKLGSHSELLIRGLRQQDSGTGITYFCHAENFDDINILSAEDIVSLISACAAETDELVIDLPCACDERIRQVFEVADKLVLVTDATKTAQQKLQQFISQNNVFERVRKKSVLVANKGAFISEPPVDTIINLPLVQSVDASAVYKTLSSNPFNI